MTRSALLLGAGLLLSACAARNAPSVGRPGLHVAEVALQSGSPDVALHVTGEILAASPDDVGALVVQGDALARLGQGEAAENSYRRALAHAPYNVGALLGEGRLILSQRPGEAEHLFLGATQAAPRNAAAWNDLGVSRDLLGRHADAQIAYRMAVGLAPEMNAAQINLALSLALSGQAAEGARLLQPLATAPGAPSRIRQDYALAAALAGDRATARRILQESVSPADAARLPDGYETLSPLPDSDRY